MSDPQIKAPPSPRSQELYLTPEEICHRYRDAITVETLANWRCSKKKVGPPWTKIGKAILYRLDQLEAWENEHTFWPKSPGIVPDSDRT